MNGYDLTFAIVGTFIGAKTFAFYLNHRSYMKELEVMRSNPDYWKYKTEMAQLKRKSEKSTKSD